MKKFLMFCFFALCVSKGFSQTLDEINDLIEKKQYSAAKAGIDKYLSNSKNANDAAGWYYKGYIYNLLSRDASTPKDQVYGLKEQAFEAFKKNQQLDRLDLQLKTEFYKSYLDLYLGYYDLGAQQFNAKDFANAYKSFTKAQEIETYIVRRNYTYTEITLNKLDTSLVMNIAAAALQAHDTANGLINYRKIVDAGITGEDYHQVYQFLAGYYYDKKDAANLTPLLVKAKAAYPKDNYWNELELQSLSEGQDKTAMFKRYEELYTQDPNNYTNTFNYAVELYNSQYGRDVTKTDHAVQEKLTSVLKAAIPNDPGIDASVAMSNHLYNWAADYSTEAALIKDGKGAKPDEIKKKKELEALTDAKMNEAIPYAEKVVKYYSEKATLTGKEKINYQQALGNLSNIYNYKNNPKKAAEYDKVKASIKF